jgi:hypothetical protein
MSVFSRVGQAMYQQAQASGDTAGGPEPSAGDAGSDTSSSNDDEEVVEGEIVEEGGSS